MSRRGPANIVALLLVVSHSDRKIPDNKYLPIAATEEVAPRIMRFMMNDFRRSESRFAVSSPAKQKKIKLAVWRSFKSRKVRLYPEMVLFKT